MDSQFLTPEQRVRLRPTVDVAALERLLAALPPEARVGIVVACFTEITRADLRAAGADVADEPPEEPPPAGRSRRRGYLPVQHSDFVVHFDDPQLARLWDAVEPGSRTAGGDP